MSSNTHYITIALGTNVNIEEMLKAQEMLKASFPDIMFSRIMPTEPLGERFQGRAFYNAVASFTTDEKLADISLLLKQAETSCGNTRELRAMGTVVIDIDLLLYDSTRLHPTDWERQYIKILTTELSQMTKQPTQTK